MVVVLDHHNTVGTPALAAALRQGVGYVGVLGSRRTQEGRRRALESAGVTAAELEAMHGPTGLDLGATHGGRDGGVDRGRDPGRALGPGGVAATGESRSPPGLTPLSGSRVHPPRLRRARHAQATAVTRVSGIEGPTCQASSNADAPSDARAAARAWSCSLVRRSGRGAPMAARVLSAADQSCTARAARRRYRRVVPVLRHSRPRLGGPERVQCGEGCSFLTLRHPVVAEVGAPPASTCRVIASPLRWPMPWNSALLCCVAAVPCSSSPCNTSFHAPDEQRPCRSEWFAQRAEQCERCARQGPRRTAVAAEASDLRPARTRRTPPLAIADAAGDLEAPAEQVIGLLVLPPGRRHRRLVGQHIGDAVGVAEVLPQRQAAAVEAVGLVVVVLFGAGLAEVGQGAGDLLIILQRLAASQAVEEQLTGLGVAALLTSDQPEVVGGDGLAVLVPVVPVDGETLLPGLPGPREATLLPFDHPDVVERLGRPQAVAQGSVGLPRLVESTRRPRVVTWSLARMPSRVGRRRARRSACRRHRREPAPAIAALRRGDRAGARTTRLAPASRCPSSLVAPCSNDIPTRPGCCRVPVRAGQPVRLLCRAQSAAASIRIDVPCGVPCSAARPSPQRARAFPSRIRRIALQHAAADGCLVGARRQRGTGATREPRTVHQVVVAGDRRPASPDSCWVRRHRSDPLIIAGRPPRRAAR